MAPRLGHGGLTKSPRGRGKKGRASLLNDEVSPGWAAGLGHIMEDPALGLHSQNQEEALRASEKGEA